MSLYNAQQSTPAVPREPAERIRKAMTSLADSIASTTVYLQREAALAFDDKAQLAAALGSDARTLELFCKRMESALKLVHPPLAKRLQEERRRTRASRKTIPAQPAA